MADKHVVDLALKYLDEAFAKEKAPTLTEMLEYVDAHDKTIMVLDEVNQLFQELPALCVQRTGGRITFATGGGDCLVSAEDLEQSFNAYHADFWERCRRLERQKQLRKSDPEG